jgi:Pentose-5-phosphate-3-epimerase
MTLIVPTIMAETTDQLRESTEKYQPFVRRVHIDISDGEFAPTFLLNEAQLSWPEGWEVDIHAMIARPSEHMDQLIKLKPSMVVLHAEAQEDIVPHLEALKKAGIKAGVALLRTTVPATVQAAIQSADHVMIFSGDLGKFGGVASMMQLEKIRLIKKIKPGVEVGWDGGVKVDNAYTLTQGGVDILNVGGEIANATDPAATYNELVKEINKHGVI